MFSRTFRELRISFFIGMFDDIHLKNATLVIEGSSVRINGEQYCPKQNIWTLTDFFADLRNIFIEGT